MISPSEIREKVLRLYGPAIKAWLASDSTFYPRRIKADLRRPKEKSLSELIREVEAIRANSKSHLGYGYTVQYEQVKSRSHGDNWYPVAIEVDSFEDLLRLTRKQTEFRGFEAAVGKILARFPQLRGWIADKWKAIFSVVDSIDELLTVVEYLQSHPRPDCYLRELPLAVSTKLIEKHKPLLREWLDIVLDVQHIHFGCSDFAQRYGFRYARKHIMVRLLDPQLLERFGFPCSEFSLPAEELNQLPAGDVHVVVVENKINQLSFPGIERGVALGGLGNNLSEFQRIKWLAKQPIVYWGDLDVDGLDILAKFRYRFPQTRSLLMDFRTLNTHQGLWTRRPSKVIPSEPHELEPHELEAFRYCRDHEIRLEQEHIPQSYLLEHMPFPRLFA